MVIVVVVNVIVVVIAGSGGRVIHAYWFFEGVARHN